MGRVVELASGKRDLAGASKQRSIESLAWDPHGSETSTIVQVAQDKDLEALIELHAILELSHALILKVGSVHLKSFLV